MRAKLIQLAVVLLTNLVLVPNFAIAQGNSEKMDEIKLFNGKDLNNWTFHLVDQTVEPSTVFSVQNGIIHITGNPYGYMRTKEIYSDYKLHAEYRWPVEAANSGVLIHMQMPDTIWSTCFECQLKAGFAGDIGCKNGTDMTERIDKTNKTVKRQADNSEKPSGEWNTIEVVCKSNTIEVYLNGILQNKGSNLSVSKGYIGLQSEGKDVEFRNVVLSKKSKK